VNPLAQGPGRWSRARVPPAALTVPGLVASRVFDAELAALLWITVEANVPLVVAAAQDEAPARAVLDAFLDLLPPTVERVELQGPRETFDWLGDAAALGWTGDDDEASIGQADGQTSRGTGIALPPRRMVPPETSYLVAGELGAGPAADIGGSRARLLIRALQRGYGLGATVRADSLEQVLVRLAAPPASVSADELRRIGIVLVLGPADAGATFESTARRDRAARTRTADTAATPKRGLAVAAPGGGSTPGPEQSAGRWRAGACHYVRPLELDAAGHLQRRPPAVLATWDPHRDQLEHFEWGVTAELAMRVGLARDDFEKEHAARTRIIAALVAAGRTSPEAIHRLLEQRAQQRAGGAS
jgi:hypothetical protein